MKIIKVKSCNECKNLQKYCINSRIEEMRDFCGLLKIPDCWIDNPKDILKKCPLEDYNERDTDTKSN